MHGDIYITLLEGSLGSGNNALMHSFLIQNRFRYGYNKAYTVKTTLASRNFRRQDTYHEIGKILHLMKVTRFTCTVSCDGTDNFRDYCVAITPSVTSFHAAIPLCFKMFS